MFTIIHILSTHIVLLFTLICTVFTVVHTLFRHIVALFTPIYTVFKLIHILFTHIDTLFHSHLHGVHTYSHTVYTHDALLLLEYKESIAYEDGFPYS